MGSSSWACALASLLLPQPPAWIACPEAFHTCFHLLMLWLVPTSDTVCLLRPQYCLCSYKLYFFFAVILLSFNVTVSNRKQPTWSAQPQRLSTGKTPMVSVPKECSWGLQVEPEKFVVSRNIERDSSNRKISDGIYRSSGGCLPLARRQT